MKNIIIGTAGHIDHGKTTLIKALTGRNTDRWEEEKRRGITIDLGFTYFDLKSGDRVGIIDVPGHEKFINNMVAGVVGMDLVMLVIAADEGIMPQTREHMDILSQLGVEKSIIVLNKCDLVDQEWIELVEEEIKEELLDTFLEDAKIIKVSASTGEGMESLVQEIEHLSMEEVKEKEIYTIPRLPIDRVFTISGFGTVVTGTLISGTLSKDTELEMYPVEKTCKIRSIQVHGESVETCYAGQRVAINISNIKKSEIKRGCVLSQKNSMKNTDLLDVKLNVLKSSSRTLENHTRLHLFTGTSEILCRAVLLDKEEIAPGESGYVQLRLEEKIALRRGDRFVVRFYSPMETMGGGTILEPNPVRKRRFQKEVIEELKCKEIGTTEDVIEMHVRAAKETMITTLELAKISALKIEEVEKDVAALKEKQQVLTFATKKETFVWHVQSELQARALVLEKLAEYHENYPYRHGINKAQIQMQYFKKIKQNIFGLYVEMLENLEIIARYNESLKLPDFQIKEDAKYQKVCTILEKELSNAGFDFKRLSDMEFLGIEEESVYDILQLKQEDGMIVKVAEDLFTLSSLLDQAVEQIKAHLEKEPLITIAQVRDMLHTSRKSAKPILEYLDSVKITKKTGAESERVSFK